MIKFFYDSLETLQKVKFATKKDYINLGLGVIAAVIIGGVFFIGVDTVWTGLYKAFYTTMRSDAIEQQLLQGEATGAVATGAQTQPLTLGTGS